MHAQRKASKDTLVLLKPQSWKEIKAEGLSLCSTYCILIISSGERDV